MTPICCALDRGQYQLISPNNQGLLEQGRIVVAIAEGFGKAFDLGGQHRMLVD
jgi:hypothetical protein